MNNTHVLLTEKTGESLRRARIRSSLEEDMHKLDNNKLSVGEFRRRWNAHFASREHTSRCTCHEGFCPFR